MRKINHRLYHEPAPPTCVCATHLCDGTPHNKQTISLCNQGQFHPEGVKRRTTQNKHSSQKRWLGRKPVLESWAALTEPNKVSLIQPCFRVQLGCITSSPLYLPIFQHAALIWALSTHHVYLTHHQLPVRSPRHYRFYLLKRCSNMMVAGQSLHFSFYVSSCLLFHYESYSFYLN